jgi:hypothetical protein
MDTWYRTLGKGVDMKRNMGSIDRTVRILLAIAVLVLYILDKISGLAAVILGILALVFVLTSLVGFCPLYLPLRLSTRKKQQ